MAIYYLSSVDGDNGSTGLDSWDNAFATFKYAVETASAAASGPHLLYVDNAHSESLSADTTITAAGDIRILCVNRSTGALATTALVGAQAASYNIIIAGAKVIYIYGIELKVPGTDHKYLALGNTDGCQLELESCKLTITSTNASSPKIYLGHSSSNSNSYFFGKNLTLSIGHASHNIALRGYCGLLDGGFAAGSTAPTTAFSYGDSQSIIRICGTDLSKVTGTLFANSTTCTPVITLTNCKLGSGVTIKAAASTVVNKGNANVWAFNCDSGDNHYAMYHGDAFGETTVSATIYANDGASYDGTNKCSWKIVTTANCSYYTPYVSPWMDVYHSGTSAISPYLEILRSGSTTKYQNDEVWGEFSYQGTSGSTKATIVSDRMTPLGTAADQTASSLDASGWTGEDATNNAFMKLEAGSITPAEIGHIRARVCVGEPSITVYVDPQVRGLS